SPGGATTPNLASRRRGAPSSNETHIAHYGGRAASAGAARPSPQPVTMTPDRASSPREVDPSRMASRLSALSWLGLAAITAIVLIAVLVRSPKTVEALEELDRQATAASPAASTEPQEGQNPSSAAQGQTAPSQELDDARLKGVAALGPLAV